GFDGTYSADLEISGVGLSSVDHMAGTDLDGDANLRLHTAGSFSTPVLNATFAVEKFSFRGTGMGTLRGSVDIKDHALKAEAGLPEDAASLTLDWMLRKPYTWTAEAEVKTDGFNPLLLFGNAALAERVKLIAEGGIRARGTGLDRSSVSGDASFSRIAVVIGEYRIDSESQPALTISRGRLAARSLDFAGPSTRFSVSGATDLSTEIDVAVKGTANLPILRLFFPEVEHATGTAEMKLTVTDEWSNPDVAGELRIRDGEIKLADIPQRFTALNGTIVFTQGRIMTESLTGEIGGGSLAASGWVQLSGVTIEDFSVKTMVDSVQVRYPEGLTSTLSGDLYFDGGTQGRSLSGDIVIKRARYDKPIEWKSMLVSFGRGLYQKKKTEIGWIGETQINVRFHGSENILFQNNLAKMQLDIDVFLRGTVNHPQFLGRIETRKGSVFLRKNEFKIVRASADFIDPNRINPVLDIQAETQVREYQIQLSITGTAERASVTLVSDPALNDTDIQSLLALGKKGSELRGKGESNVGIGEAASFATGLFQDVLERRAKSLTGLDRFQVDPYVSKNDTSVPRVTAGKELIQNKLFVTYSSNVGAPAPEQNFRIEYILNKHFSLVGEGKETINNGTDIGADIKYRFEFQ
ncbi:MAG TPA: translocation/assembly module TamB domain-containing protein, partial [Nitrospirota bacterium]|nr:translocation/assembly module TamB domain-containing protein [Nitrospirota bacterium]